LTQWSRWDGFAIRRGWTDRLETSRQALAKPATFEQFRRVEKLLQSTQGIDIGQRQRRTLMLLEQIGTSAAAQMLTDLTDGDIDPELKEDAKSALVRMKNLKVP
jgi:hypothetical protein